MMLFKRSVALFAFFGAIVACGSSSDEDGTGSTSGGSAGDGAYCETPAAGCQVKSTLDSGTFTSCLEIHTVSGQASAGFQADCEAPPSDPRDEKTFLPGGCPRDATVGCGLVTEVSGNYGLTFVYVSGNALFDDNGVCKTTCPTAAANGQPACCPGALYP